MTPDQSRLTKVADIIIQWSPAGGSTALFFHFLREGEWIQAALIFPLLLAAAVWAKYVTSFIETLGVTLSEKAASDAKSFERRLTKLDKDFRWRLSAADDRYLRAQANACRYYAVEGVGKNRWNPATILEEVYVPLELSGRFNQAGFAEGMAMDAAIGRVAPAEAQPQYIWDLLRQVEQPHCRHIAIIAPGGFGKTTLLRHVTYRYSYGVITISGVQRRRQKKAYPSGNEKAPEKGIHHDSR